MLSPEIKQAYREADYRFAETILTIDKLSATTAALLKPFAPKGGLFITAYNPMGEDASLTSNKLANIILKEDLLSRGLTVIAGYGEGIDKITNERHREDSFFAYPVDEKTSLEICIKYAQNAVVYINTDGVPSLRFNPKLNE